MSLEKIEQPASPAEISDRSISAQRADRIIRFMPLALLVIALAVISLTVEHFLTASNLLSVLVQTSALGLLAIGQAIVLISGGIDLSMPGMMALGAIIGATYMRDGGNIGISCLIMVAISVGLGMINGYSVAYLKMIPFVVTLAMQAITFGAAVWVTNQISISGLPQAFMNTMLADVWVIPLPVIILVVVAVVVQLFLVRSIYGRWLYATGTNVRAARVSGVPTERALFFAYAFSGLMAGIAGIILTARLYSAGAPMGRDAVVLDIVSSAALGGVSIFGGVGSAANAVVGAIIMTLINNVMNMANVSYYITLVVKGFVIVAVVALDYLRRR